MLTHVVMFKLKDKQDADLMREKLMALPNKIAQIKHYEVGINMMHGDSAYDVTLISKFDSLEGLEAYKMHPDHVEVLNYIKTVTSDIIRCDYED